MFNIQDDLSRHLGGLPMVYVAFYGIIYLYHDLCSRVRAILSLRTYTQTR